MQAREEVPMVKKSEERGSSKRSKTKQAVALEQLAPEEVPEQLRPEFYFDFQARPFAHAGLFQWEGVNSVVTALGAIGNYASDWLSRELPPRAKVAHLFEDNFPKPCQAVGHFLIVLEPGALCRPAQIVGSLETERPPHVLHLAQGARLVGVSVFLEEGDIFIGEGTTVEPGVGIKGPAIIGKDCEVRQGAYLRGDVIVGERATIRGELKNVVLMD